MSSTFLLKRSATALKTPATTSMLVGEVASNTNDGTFFTRGNNGADFVQLIGGPGFLKSDVLWGPSTTGLTAQENYEFGQRVYLFAQGNSESLLTWLKVPRGYLPGAQILLRVPVYSPDTSNYVRLSTTTTLIRKATDAVTSTTNQRTSTNADLQLSTANLYTEQVFDLTDTSGKINSVIVNPGDLLIVILTRTTPSAGTEDTADLRVVADVGEVTFN